MVFEKLHRHDKEVEATREARAQEKFDAAVKKAVTKKMRDAAKAPTRGRGRSPQGGVTRQEVAKMRKRAIACLESPTGLRDLEQDVQRTALVVLFIDGLLGTEPWRAWGGNGPLIAAQSRIRYLENAARLLDDLRRSKEGTEPKLLEGVLDGETVTPSE